MGSFGNHGCFEFSGMQHCHLSRPRKTLVISNLSCGWLELHWLLFGFSVQAKGPFTIAHYRLHVCTQQICTNLRKYARRVNDQCFPENVMWCNMIRVLMSLLCLLPVCQNLQGTWHSTSLFATFCGKFNTKLRSTTIGDHSTTCVDLVTSNTTTLDIMKQYTTMPKTSCGKSPPNQPSSFHRETSTAKCQTPVNIWNCFRT